VSLARMAGRNLWRSPRRTVLTSIAVFAGVAISIVGRGFIGGTDESIIRGATDGTVGHVQAMPADYPSQAMQHPVDDLLEIPDAARALLAEVAWTERTYLAPLAAHGSTWMRVEAVGIDFGRDAAVFPRDLWSVDGELPRTGQHEVALSPRLAELLGVARGDTFVLQQRTHRGAINALEVRVAAISQTRHTVLDKAVLMPHTLAAELIASPLASHLSVRLRDRDDAAAFAPKLAAALGTGAKVVTWETEVADLLQLQAARRKALNAVVFVLLALAAFGIANTVLMSAYERVREVGTLRSLGMTEGGVLRLFVLEGALVGVLGGLVGALAGGGLVARWNVHPLDFSELVAKQGATFPAITYLYAHFSPAGIVATFALGVAVAALASIYPGRVAARMPPADAVRAAS
jgi:putative ABC transport system permease protein